MKAVPSSQSALPYPYVMRLKDGRHLTLAIPQDWVESRDGETLFKPAAVELIQSVQAMHQVFDASSTRGHLVALRQALGMTQQQFGAALKVDKLTVSRWERGQVRPGPDAIKRIRALQVASARRGVRLAV